MCDASFIGLAKLLTRPLELAAPDAMLVALFKPQFEVGPANVGKGGIVSRPAAVAAAADELERWLAKVGWVVRQWSDSPITGADGNRERLFLKFGVTRSVRPGDERCHGAVLPFPAPVRLSLSARTRISLNVRLSTKARSSIAKRWALAAVALLDVVLLAVACGLLLTALLVEAGADAAGADAIAIFCSAGAAGAGRADLQIARTAILVKVASMFENREGAPCLAFESLLGQLKCRWI